MKMNPERNRAKARASPVSAVLCGPSTMISEQGSLYLHRHPDAMLNEQGGHRNFFSNDSTQSCLGAYAPINFTQDTQKKYFDPIGRGRVKNNTLFKKREEYVITYKSGSSKTQIDFLLMRKDDRITCKDCKVIPGESLANQHRLLVMDVHIKRVRKKKKT
ncbi:hypothetical protein ACFX2J_032096 [Malus domestica]